ncbi:MAG: hypothetical protein HYU66_02065, partial [Armatimonadetes bacterium]|nr:hypothetical protein [Armatimonadota bacterium]
IGKDGHPGVLMVNNESTLAGITGVAANGGLGVVSARTDEPMVFFLRL